MLTSISLVLAVVAVAGMVSQGWARSAAPINPSVKAQQLVTAYREHRNDYQPADAVDALQQQGGGLHYDEDGQRLIGRVYINAALITDAPPEELANYRRMVEVLNDPKVGGMFDRAGGYFVLDEQAEAYYLRRDFPVATTTSRELIKAMDAMHAISSIWVTDWLYQVAMIMHGHQQPPTTPITRANAKQR